MKLNLSVNQIDNINVFKRLYKNDTLTKLNLSKNKIDNIEVFKCLENNHFLIKLDLNEYKINENDLENIFNQVL